MGLVHRVTLIVKLQLETRTHRRYTSCSRRTPEACSEGTGDNCHHCSEIVLTHKVSIAAPVTPTKFPARTNLSSVSAQPLYPRGIVVGSNPLMKSIRTYGREIALLALIVCAVGFASKRNDDIVPEVAVDARFSRGQFDEECRLKMSYVAHRVEPVKQMRYPDDISWLELETPLTLVYRLSEDRKSYLLTCLDSHHQREGATLRPVATGKGYGLLKSPAELKAPSTSDVNLSLRDFLGLPRFEGSYAVHKMGRFYVLVHVFTFPEGADEQFVLLPLNPDNELKSLHEGTLTDPLPIAYGLSEEARATVIRKYQVDDPFVLDRLDPTWDKHSYLKGSVKRESLDGEK